MGSAWSESHERVHQDAREIISASQLAAHTFLGKVLDTIRSRVALKQFMASSSSAASSIASVSSLVSAFPEEEHEVDIHAAIIAYRIGKGFFGRYSWQDGDDHSRSNRFCWKTAHLLLHTVYDVVHENDGDCTPPPSPPQRHRMYLVPDIKKVRCAGTTARELSLSVKQFQDINFVSHRMRPLVKIAVRAPAQGRRSCGSDLRERDRNTEEVKTDGTPSKERYHQEKLQARIQKNIHLILCRVRQCDDFPDRVQQASLKVLVRRWLDALQPVVGEDLVTASPNHLHTIPSPVFFQMFCGAACRTTFKIPNYFFKKKKVPKNTRALQTRLSTSFVAPVAHRMPGVEANGPLANHTCKTNNGLEQTKDGGSELQMLDLDGLPDIPDFKLDLRTADTNASVLILSQNSQPGSQPSSRLGEGATSSSLSSSTSSTNLIEKLFGKLSRNMSSSEVPPQDSIPPMCAEQLSFSPVIGGSHHYYNDENSIFGASNAPPLIPEEKKVPFLDLSKPSSECFDPLKENRKTTPMAGSGLPSGRPVMKKKRRRRTLELINPEEHEIPNSNNKSFRLWHTNPLTGAYSPKRWYCHVKSCYEGRASVKAYKSFPVLQQHYKYHVTVPQHCPICDQTFSSRGSRDTHIRKQHNGVIDTGTVPPQAKRRKTIAPHHKSQFSRLLRDDI